MVSFFVVATLLPSSNDRFNRFTFNYISPFVGGPFRRQRTLNYYVKLDSVLLLYLQNFRSQCFLANLLIGELFNFLNIQISISCHQHKSKFSTTVTLKITPFLLNLLYNKGYIVNFFFVQ